MDRIDAGTGFMPGVFKKSKKRASTTNSAGSSSKHRRGPKQLILKWLPRKYKDHLLAMSGEFVGTFMFLFFAFAGTQVANSVQSTSGNSSTTLPQAPNPTVLQYIALSFGFSLAVNAWIFYRVTGGLFNPAVTLGLCLIGAVPFVRGGLIFIAQMLGAMAVSGVVKALFPGPLAVTTTLGGGTSLAQGLFIEMFLTAQLVFTIFMLAAEKHKSTFLAPIGIGLSLFIAELAGVYFTGGSLNPARSFGPCVANHSFPSEHWIYWVGPFLGALIAAGFFWFIKSAEYETVNPGQDFDDLEAGAFDPEKDIQRPVVHPTHGSMPDDEQTDDIVEGDQPEPQPDYQEKDLGSHDQISHDRASPVSYRNRTPSSGFPDGGTTQTTLHDFDGAPPASGLPAGYHDVVTGPYSHASSQPETLSNIQPGTDSNVRPGTNGSMMDRPRNSFTI